MLALRATYGAKEENSWTFGQIVPLILLAAPIASVVDHLSTRPEALNSQESVVLICDGEANNARSQRCSSRVAFRRYVAQDYEASISFRGAFLLAALSYTHLAAFTVFTDSMGIFYPLSRLAITFVILSPTLQTTWILYVLWVPTLPMRKVQANFVLMVIFLILVLIWSSEAVPLITFAAQSFRIAVETESVGSFFAYSQLRRSRGIFADGPLYVAILLITYLLLIGWFALNCAIKKLDFGRRKKLRVYCSNSLRIAAAVILPGSLLPFMLNEYYWGGQIPWKQEGQAFGEIILLQVIVQLIEVTIERQGWRSGYLIRAGIILGMGVPMVCVLWITATRDLIVICAFTCPLWVIFWACHDMCSCS